VDSQDLRRAHWRTSTYSANGSTCIEVASNLPDVVLVRDSKDRGGPALAVSHQAWSEFIEGIKCQEFDL
jgi:hypothetical protein